MLELELKDLNPLTPSLSPLGRGEGEVRAGAAGNFHASQRVAGPVYPLASRRRRGWG